MTVTLLGPPATSILDRLNADEQQTFAGLTAKLGSYATTNAIKAAYYEAEQRIKHMGIAIPPEVANRINPVVGWAGTVVDVLEERLDWQGWTEFDDDDEDLGLADIYRSNRLDVEAGLGHLDALIYGTAFIRVGAGDKDEPSPLVTIHSPRGTTGEWDARSRRLRSALTITGSEESGMSAILDVPGQTITLERSKRSTRWMVVDRDEHNLGRIPVARLVNRPRASRTQGRSEITKAVRYYCDAAMRTALGMEGNREFYSIPQLTMVGRGADAFVDAAGNPVPGWRILAGHALAIDRDEDGNVPEISQLSVGSPEPFLGQVRGLAQWLAAEAGMPASYLGFATDNPASADAIRAGESRLVKRSERRQTGFSGTWMEVGELALLVRDGSIPEDFASRVGANWRDASTPTRSAQSDEATKLIAAAVLPPDSSVTYSRLGFTPSERLQLAADARKRNGNATLEAMAGVPTTTNGDTPEALKAKFDALGVAIRAGIDPSSAAALLGLEGLKFTGAVPVTLRDPNATAPGAAPAAIGE